MNNWVRGVKKRQLKRACEQARVSRLAHLPLKAETSIPAIKHVMNLKKEEEE